MKKFFTKDQPKDGEIILICPHPNVRSSHHFFKFLNSVPFTRPDKTNGLANWMVVCEECLKLHPNNPGAVITGDKVWIGDEPIIEEGEVN